MIVTIAALLSVSDRYMALAGIGEEKTLSYRVFGDSKKLTALRDGSDITLTRFNAAMGWFAAQWPDDHPPEELRPYLPTNPNSESSHAQPSETKPDAA